MNIRVIYNHYLLLLKQFSSTEQRIHKLNLQVQYMHYDILHDNVYIHATEHQHKNHLPFHKIQHTAVALL